MRKEGLVYVLESDGTTAELGRQPRRARDFVIRDQDRIMFGSDDGMDEAMYRNRFRWLQTADEYFDYWGYPAQGRWTDPVLEKIYHRDGERIF